MWICFSFFILQSIFLIWDNPKEACKLVNLKLYPLDTYLSSPPVVGPTLPWSFNIFSFLYIFLLFVTTAPPCPVVIILLGAKEKQPAIPNVPRFLLLILDPNASAASSITFIDFSLHILIIFFILLPLPEICTGTKNLVFLVIFFLKNFR